MKRSIMLLFNSSCEGVHVHICVCAIIEPSMENWQWKHMVNSEN